MSLAWRKLAISPKKAAALVGLAIVVGAFTVGGSSKTVLGQAPPTDIRPGVGAAVDAEGRGGLPCVSAFETFEAVTAVPIFPLTSTRAAVAASYTCGSQQPLPLGGTPTPVFVSASLQLIAPAGVAVGAEIIARCVAPLPSAPFGPGSCTIGSIVNASPGDGNFPIVQGGGTGTNGFEYTTYEAVFPNLPRGRYSFELIVSATAAGASSAQGALSVIGFSGGNP